MFRTIHLQTILATVPNNKTKIILPQNNTVLSLFIATGASKLVAISLLLLSALKLERKIVFVKFQYRFLLNIVMSEYYA